MNLLLVARTLLRPFGRVLAAAVGVVAVVGIYGALLVAAARDAVAARLRSATRMQVGADAAPRDSLPDGQSRPAPRSSD